MPGAMGSRRSSRPRSHDAMSSTSRGWRASLWAIAGRSWSQSGALVSVYGYLSAKLLGMLACYFRGSLKRATCPRFCRRQPQFHHALVLDPLLRGGGMGPRNRRKFCLECDAVGSRSPLLLRCSLCGADRSPPKTAVWPAGFRLPGGPVLAVLGVLIAAGVGSLRAHEIRLLE